VKIRAFQQRPHGQCRWVSANHHGRYIRHANFDRAAHFLSRAHQLGRSRRLMSVHYDTSNPRRARHPRDGIANIIRRQAFTIRINNEYAEATIAKISGNHPTPCGWFDLSAIEPPAWSRRYPAIIRLHAGGSIADRSSARSPYPERDGGLIRTTLVTTSCPCSYVAG